MTMRSKLDSSYSGKQIALSHVVVQRASALKSLGRPRSDEAMLIAYHHPHAVALGLRYYNMASLASGHGMRGITASVTLPVEHIQNAIDASDGDYPGVAQNLVIGGMRDAVIAASASDSLSTGWERVTEPGACDYCVSKSGVGGDGFPAHYYCNCTASPVFKEAS